MVPLVVLKYYMLPSAVALMFPYLFSWQIIVVEHHFILGPFFLALRTLVPI